MSRKDTIIVALLVNAGLLALLFMLAINTEDESIAEHPEITNAILDRPSLPPFNPQAAPPILGRNVHDEVDDFLKELAAEDATQSLMLDEEGYIELQPTALPVIAPPLNKEISLLDDTTYVEVTVKRGDALEKIARSNGTTVDAIKKANGLATAKLSIGQVLHVPIPKKSEGTFVKSSSIDTPQVIKEIERKPIANSEVHYYTIKSGDNPWKIAKQFNVKFDELLKLNNLDEETARNLKIGDKVRVK